MSLTHIGPFVYQRFEPVMPALASGIQEAQAHPVLIVGGGPVGLATALGLARWGVRSVVLEADDSVCEGSRAACISRRSLEILDRLGVVRRFMDKGLAWTTGRSFYGTEEVFRLEMPASPQDQFPPMVNLQQYYIEQFLLEEIGAVNAAAPGMIDVRWQHRVVHVAQEPQGVALTVETPLGSYQSAAQWLVACDGGQSFVRSSLGLALKGVAYQGRYAIVDIELPSTSPTERRAWFDPPWVRGTTILMHRQPDNIWRIDYQLAPDQDPNQVLDAAQVQAFVQTHLDAIGEGHLPWKPVWTSVYRAGAMTLDSYRHSRILFAGNAAHAMPIFGVRGLNSGLDDADNLVWKLAACIQGRGGEALLDTYSQERVAAFHTNASSAMRSTEFMSPPHRGFELMREAALSLAGRHTGIARLVNPRQTQAITYLDSPLSAPSDAFHQGTPVGAPLEAIPAEDGRFLTDLLVPQAFTFFCVGDPLEEVVAALSEAAFQATTIPCHIVMISAASQAATALGMSQGSAYLVRPDGHVAARWRKVTAAEVCAAIEQACQTPRRLQ